VGGSKPSDKNSLLERIKHMRPETKKKRMRHFLRGNAAPVRKTVIEKTADSRALLDGKETVQHGACPGQRNLNCRVRASGRD